MAELARYTPQPAKGERASSLLAAGALLGPATIVIALGLVLPVLILFRYSLNKFDPRLMMIEAVTVANYAKFFTDPFYTHIFFTTLRVALACTLICLLAAFPLAYVLARSESRYKNVLLMLVVLPLFVGNAVRAAGWMTLLGSKGALNAALIKVGLIVAPLEIMYTQKAVIIGIIAVNLPYMVLTLQSVLEGIPRNLEEAAFNLGAGPFLMFRRVLWPLAFPGIVAGTILCFILAMNAYATPVLLGGPQFKMMGPLVFGQFRLNNWPFGAAIAFVLMTATLLLAASANLFMHRYYRRVL
jgi:putative spermidine/putrescine transport system permease protein